MISDDLIWNKYKTAEKSFLLMPLMHAENKKYTQLCEDEFVKLQNYCASTDPDRYENGGVRDWLSKNLKFAQDHNKVVQ